MVAALDKAIAAKGWKKVDEGGEADIHVIVHGATDTKHSANTFYSGGMGGYGYRYGGMGGGTATTTVSEYTVGTLVVDMFDAKTKNLVFRGTAADEIRTKRRRTRKSSTRPSKNYSRTSHRRQGSSP